MGVKVVLLLFLFASPFSAAHRVVNEDDPLVIKARYHEAASDLLENLSWLEVAVKKCMRSEVSFEPNYPGKHYSEVCIGKSNSLLKSEYTKRLKRLKRFFVAYLIKSMDPFRARFEDEMMYLIFLLNFHINRDLKIQQGLQTAVGTAHYQVNARKFQILLGMIDEHLQEFYAIQDKIAETKLAIVGYLMVQEKQLEAASREAAKKFFEEDIGWTELH